MSRKVVHTWQKTFETKRKKKKKRSDQKLQSLRLKTFKLKLDNLSYSSSLECRSIWHVIEFKQYVCTHCILQNITLALLGLFNITIMTLM